MASDLIPITEIAVETSKARLKANLRALNAEQHVHIHELIQPGSLDLQTLFFPVSIITTCREQTIRRSGSATLR